MNLFELAKWAIGKAGDTARAASEEPSARRAGMPTYSRHVPNPAWGDKRPGPGDRVVGRQVVRDAPRPFGEAISGGEWLGDFGNEYAATPPSSAEVGVGFFAARQALADRKR